MKLSKNRNVKIIIANALVVLCYFLMMVYNYLGVSGGDIALELTFILSILIHFILLVFLLTIPVYRKSHVFSPLLKGLALGILISFLIFSSINYHISSTSVYGIDSTPVKRQTP